MSVRFPWSEREYQTLLRMKAQGMPHAAIAERLGRPVASIKRKHAELKKRAEVQCASAS